jgi:DNA primase
MLDLRLVVTDRVLGPVKVRCVNPDHEDPNASMTVYADNIHCFGCGFHRNDYDEALALLRAAGAKGNGKGKVHKSRPAKPPTLGVAQMYHRFLRESRTQRLSWLYARGLTDESIDMALLGHDGGRFTIPVFDANGKLVTIRFRNDDVYGEWAKYSGWPGVNQTYLYGANWIDESDNSFVVLTEGELDALRLRQSGLCSCSVTNGAGNSHAAPSLLSGMRLGAGTRLVVATDQDSAGDSAAIQTAREAARLGFEVWRWEWWDAKDITEHLNNNGTLQVLWRKWDGHEYRRTGGPSFWNPPG